MLKNKDVLIQKNITTMELAGSYPVEWANFLDLCPALEEVDRSKEQQNYQAQRTIYPGDWVIRTKLFIIRNEHPEDMEILKPYIDDSTVMLTYKELFLKLNTNFKEKIGYLFPDFDWENNSFDFDPIWGANFRLIIIPDYTPLSDTTVVMKLLEDKDNHVVKWVDFLKEYPEAAGIEWDKKNLPVRAGFVL